VRFLLSDGSANERDTQRHHPRRSRSSRHKTGKPHEKGEAQGEGEKETAVGSINEPTRTETGKKVSVFSFLDKFAEACRMEML
jgi:hypothetical protein